MNSNTLTTPVWNVLKNEDDIIWWQNTKMSLYRSLHKPLVEFHKDRLGKQSYCYQSEYRYWVWENYKADGLGWRVYVSNKGGVCFEVTKNSSVDQVKKLFYDYLKKMNVQLI